MKGTGEKEKGRGKGEETILGKQVSSGGKRDFG